MSDIFWSRVYGGRVRHAFTDERREVPKKRKIFGDKVERRTLCGKWFAYFYDQWEYFAQSGYPRCKKCLSKEEKAEELIK